MSLSRSKALIRECEGVSWIKINLASFNLLKAPKILKSSQNQPFFSPSWQTSDLDLQKSFLIFLTLNYHRNIRDVRQSYFRMIFRPWSYIYLLILQFWNVNGKKFFLLNQGFWINGPMFVLEMLLVAFEKRMENSVHLK